MTTETYTTRNTELATWFERDRQNVELLTCEGKTLLDVWDDDVTQLVEDGFLDVRHLHRSACEYVNSLGR